MEQVFWIQAEISPGTGVRVDAPEGIQLLDRTKPGSGRRFSRFYFRADRGVAGAQVVLWPVGGAPVTVPVSVRTYREDVTEQIKLIPGLDPSVRKQGKSYFTPAMIAIAKGNMATYPPLGENLRKATRFDHMTDVQLWEALPSWNVPRQCYSNWPCPTCGEKIFSKSGFYPWGKSYANPFKGTCPACKQLFPSNDYANDDFTSGPCPDDGWGHDPGTGERNDFHGWVAHYNHHVAWHGSGSHLRRLGLRYLLCGDAAAAHAAGVLLARMAYVYPGMNMRWQQVRTKYLRPGRALIDGNWERNDLLVPALQTYDAIFDFLDTDTKLVEFLHAKDPAIKTADDVKALLDTCLVQVFGWDWMRRELSGGNQGAREEDMAQFVACANMGTTGDSWLEELFTHAYNSGINRGGFDDEALINTLTREGPTLVSGLGYAYGYTVSKSDMAEILSRVVSPRWQTRCALYDPAVNPKFRAEFDTWIDLLAAGQFGPSYGDSGGGRAARFPQGIPARLPIPYARAYRRWPTDKLARAIHRAGKRPPLLFEPDVWPRIEKHVAEIGPGPPLESRVLDGMGFAILESRPHAAQLKERAAVALRYGYAVGHHHHDNLNVEMWAHGESVSPELGYPCWAHPMGNTGFVAHHNTGMIDRKGQYTGGIAKGSLEQFAKAPGVSFVDVSAEPNGFPNRAYHRAVCLVDAPQGNVYLFDLLRMAGGETRTFCFHGPGHKSWDSSLEFGPEMKGPWRVSGMGRNLKANILDARRARSDQNAWADWACDRSDMHVRLDLLAQPGRSYITATCGKTDLPPIRYLFAEDEKVDSASQFVAFWQPYLGAPFIRATERLTVTGSTTGAFQPVAVCVALPEGRTDTFIYSGDGDAPLQVGDIEFQGHFGFWSERNGKPRCMQLVNGSTLAKGSVGTRDAKPYFRTTVASVNQATREVTLAQALPNKKTLNGSLIYFRNGSHRTAYHIEEILPGGHGIRLDLDGIIFRSKITEFAKDGSHVTCELAPRIPSCGGSAPHGYYDGAFATSEDLSATYRVTKTIGNRVCLAPNVQPEHFTDTDGDGRRMLRIYDIGAGDEATIANSLFLSFPQ